MAMEGIKAMAERWKDESDTLGRRGEEGRKAIGQIHDGMVVDLCQVSAEDLEGWEWTPFCQFKTWCCHLFRQGSCRSPLRKKTTVLPLPIAISQNTNALPRTLVQKKMAKEMAAPHLIKKRRAKVATHKEEDAGPAAQTNGP